MTIIVEIYPQCDFCKDTYADDRRTTKKSCRDEMKKDGWKIIDGKDICPICIRKSLDRLSRKG